MIRTATADDVEQVVALINEAFLVERFFIDGDRTSPGEVRRLQTTGAFLVDQTAEGPLDAAIYVEPRGDRGYFGLLAVAPGAQGRGVGRAMIAAAENWCRERGCRAMDIRVVSLRTELFPIYARLGYVELRTTPFVHAHPPKVPCHFVELTKNL